MTNTRSAAKTGLPSPRRASPIDEAFREYQRLAKIADDLAQIVAEIEPERPRYRVTSSTNVSVIVRSVRGEPVLYLDVNDDKNVAYLQTALLLSASRPDGLDPVTLERMEALTRTTLNEIMTWRAERDRRRAECGLIEAEANAKAARDAEIAQRDLLLAMPAETIRDLGIKATVIIMQNELDRKQAYLVFDRLLELAGLVDHEAADEPS